MPGKHGSYLLYDKGISRIVHGIGCPCLELRIYHRAILAIRGCRGAARFSKGNRIIAPCRKAPVNRLISALNDMRSVGAYERGDGNMGINEKTSHEKPMTRRGF